VDERFCALDAKMDERFCALDAKMEHFRTLDEKMNRLNAMMEQLLPPDARKAVDTKLQPDRVENGSSEGNKQASASPGKSGRNLANESALARARTASDAKPMVEISGLDSTRNPGRSNRGVQQKRTYSCRRKRAGEASSESALIMDDASGCDAGLSSARSFHADYV
jgi:hypothetical protein